MSEKKKLEKAKLLKNVPTTKPEGEPVVVGRPEVQTLNEATLAKQFGED